MLKELDNRLIISHCFAPPTPHSFFYFPEASEPAAGVTQWCTSTSPMMTRTWLDLPDRPLSRDSSQAAERERAKTTGSSEEKKDAGSHYNAKTDDWPVAGGSFLEHSQYFSASSLLTVSSRTGVLTYIQPSHLPPFQPHRHDLTQRWQISQTWKKREAGCHKPSNYGGGGRRDVVVCSLLCVCVCWGGRWGRQVQQMNV